MQMACIEGARNTAGIANASTTEFGPTDEPVVGLITEWMTAEGLQKREEGGDLGGTMRLGAYDAKLTGNSHVAAIYGGTAISERHRHRYEVNVHYKDALEKGGMVFSGMSPDGELPEIVERPDHPWFVGVQFHPRTQEQAVRTAPAVRQLHRSGAQAEPVGLIDARCAVVPSLIRDPGRRTKCLWLWMPDQARHDEVTYFPAISRAFIAACVAAISSLLTAGALPLASACGRPPAKSTAVQMIPPAQTNAIQRFLKIDLLRIGSMSPCYGPKLSGR